MNTIGQRLNPAPPVTAYLTVSDGQAAVAFYEKAFGAEETYRGVADDGRRIMHSQLRMNGGVIFLSDHFAEYHDGAPAPAPAGMMLHLEVDDVDAWFNRAVAAGASVRLPVSDQFWGDRYGQIVDPFGHCWSIATPIRMTPVATG